VGGRATAAAAVVLGLWFAARGVEAKPGGHPRRRPVDAVIIHSLGGPDCRAGAPFFRAIDGDARHWMATFNRLPIVSIHYVIDRTGLVEAGVPEDVAATHATGWNQRSVGIELVNNGDGRDPFPPAQIEALVALVTSVRQRHPAITPARVLRHSDVDHSTFPAATHGEACTAFRRKLDPGDAFPWTTFLARVAGVPGARH
jgi:N-acetylmuramoyl-L-alanine amidase